MVGGLAEGTKREERAALAVAITMKVRARLIHRGTVRGLHWGISARDDSFSSLGSKKLTVEDAQSTGNTWESMYFYCVFMSQAWLFFNL